MGWSAGDRTELQAAYDAMDATNHFAYAVWARGWKKLVHPPEKANGAVETTAPCRLLVHFKV